MIDAVMNAFHLLLMSFARGALSFAFLKDSWMMSWNLKETVVVSISREEQWGVVCSS